MEIDLNRIHEKLAHLSANQITSLCERYMNEKLKDLIAEFHIEVSPAGLSKILPPRILSDEICPYCNILMRQRILKGEYTNKKSYCISCGHHSSYNCQCYGCEKERKEKENYHLRKIEQLLADRFGKYDTPRNLYDIPLKDSVYLAAFLRATSQSTLSNYLYFEDNSVKLSPNQYYTTKIIEYLLKNSYIKIDMDLFSPNTLFSPEEQLDRFSLLTCRYNLLVYAPNLGKNEIHDKLYFPDIKNAGENEFREVWTEIAQAECLEYVIYKIKNIGIHYKYFPKHLKHIEQILNNFSVSQFYSMYFNTLKSVYYSLTSKGINSVQVLNSSIYGTLSYAEKAIAREWHITKYNREPQCEQSIISHVFFSSFLPIEKAGFYECPADFKLPV